MTLHKMIIMVSISIIITIYIHSIVVLVETYLKRDQHVKLLNQFEELNRTFEKNKNIQFDQMDIKRTCNRYLKWYMLILLFIAVIDVLFLIRSKNRFSAHFTLIYSFPFALSKLSYVYSMSLVSFIRHYIDALTTYSEWLNKEKPYSPNKTFVNPNEFKMSKWKYIKLYRSEVSSSSLLFIKQSYCQIWEASIIVNNILYYSLSLGILNEFLVLIIFNFSFISSTLRRYKASETKDIRVLSVLLNLSFIASVIVIILFLTGTCRKTTVAVSIYTVFYVH